ncbi:MAG: UDP-N-acetylmuramoyl-tripeptide--D-alanyl-D-alanine ligase [bacterium]|nr:UDP-N-acetylmuramoyl-tripeptide--D-alanyl-D-alanine ligase [bacterium]
MIRFHLRDILRGTGGALITSAVGPEMYTGISTDSRTVAPGEVFFALRGEKHDGHDHLKDAWKAGAVLAVVDRRFPMNAGMMAPIPLVVVDDTVKALQGLAALWRVRHPMPALAVVGSAGKTTTKEMTAAVLGTAGPCLKNIGNLNNHIGLPLSILEMADFHRYAVLEIGTNMPGEIRQLASILGPEGAILTRIGWAHLEGFGDHETLLAEKLSILDALPGDGWCAVNAGDPNQASVPARAACRVVTYGIGTGEVRGKDLVISECESAFTLVSPSGSERVRLCAFGVHFVENALAAAAGVLPLGIPIEQVAGGLAGWRPARQRGGIISPMPGVRFIDDTYNANPLSVETALANLARLSSEGVTVAVLGEMKELGAYHEEGHRLVGLKAARMGIDYLIAVGEVAPLIVEGALRGSMERSRVMECGTIGEAVKAVEPLLTSGVWVLFKGSRAARVEEVMEPFVGSGDNGALAGSGGI